MYEAVLSVNLMESWIGKLTSVLPVEANLLDSIPLGGGGVQDLIELKLNNIPREQVIETVESFKMVDFVKSSSSDQDRIILIVGSKSCGGCSAMLESDCFLISAATKNDGWVEWKLVVNEKKQLQSLVESLKKRGIDSKLVKITPVDDKETLTSRQELIIKKALERGYFDFPKRIGIRELGRIFSISTASVSETLRRGQKKIIEHYFEKRNEL